MKGRKDIQESGSCQPLNMKEIVLCGGAISASGAGDLEKIDGIMDRKVHHNIVGVVLLCLDLFSKRTMTLNILLTIAVTTCKESAGTLKIRNGLAPSKSGPHQPNVGQVGK